MSKDRNGLTELEDRMRLLDIASISFLNSINMIIQASEYTNRLKLVIYMLGKISAFPNLFAMHEFYKKAQYDREGKIK